MPRVRPPISVWSRRSRAIRAAGVAALLIAAAWADTPANGEWTFAAGDFATTRFSPLDQINTQNASQLKLAWTFDPGTRRGQEAAPIVVGSTMFVVTPFPNYLYALDLT